MVSIGQFNRLKVVKIVEFGVYLDGDHLDNILLPNRYVPDGVAVGDDLDVFLYMDSDDIPIATTLKPLAKVGECAYLRVTDVNNTGAFLDWGLPKDILVPYAEQHKPLEVGRSYVAHLYLCSHSDRILATTRLNRHLAEQGGAFTPNQKVNLLVCGKSDMGIKVVVDHTHLGLVFKDDAFKSLKYGEKSIGYVKNIRPDGKLDIDLQLPSGLGRKDLGEQIIDYLIRQGGTSNLTDKADPNEIYQLFNVSKKNYKKAIGALYKQKRILIADDVITLVNNQ